MHIYSSAWIEFAYIKSAKEDIDTDLTSPIMTVITIIPLMLNEQQRNDNHTIAS